MVYSGESRQKIHGKFWLKPVWMIHETSLERKRKFEAIIETDDKTERDGHDIQIDKLDELTEQYQEIDIGNKGKAKTEGNILDDTNIPGRRGRIARRNKEEEELGNGNLLEVETKESGPKESTKQRVLKDINVKTTSKILSTLHKEI